MASHTYTEGRATRRHLASSRSIAQSISLLFGLAFIALGVAGFIPSLTTNSIDLANTGPDSNTFVFGLFQVSVLHNLVHIGFGVLGLMAASGPRLSRTFLVLGGLAYLALTAYGFMIDLSSNDNILPVNTNDNWLHLGLGSAMILLGLLTIGRRDHRDTDLAEN